MAALGNTLSALSIGLTKVGQIGLDLSHIATFIASVYGGPVMGFLIGLVGGSHCSRSIDWIHSRVFVHYLFLSGSCALLLWLG